MVCLNIEYIIVHISWKDKHICLDNINNSPAFLSGFQIYVFANGGKYVLAFTLYISTASEFKSDASRRIPAANRENQTAE